MKAKNLKILNEQKDQGDSLTTRLNSISNTEQLDELINEYDSWDNATEKLLKDGFVQPQFHNMFKGQPYLGNAHVKTDSFQDKRDRIFYSLPKKLSHLKTAITYTETARPNDLLPLEDKSDFLKISNREIKDNKMKKLFVSHSSLDDAKIKPLIDLINLIGVPHDKVFYCSIEGYGLSPGENLFDGLKKELSNEVFALFMLSKNFYESQICLCEMGAVWIKSHKQIPIVIPPMKYSEMNGVFPNTIGLELNNQGNMDTLKGELELFFGLTPMSITRWREKVDEYLLKVNLVLAN